GGERDAAGRPDRGRARVHGGEEEPELAGEDVDQGQGGQKGPPCRSGLRHAPSLFRYLRYMRALRSPVMRSARARPAPAAWDSMSAGLADARRSRLASEAYDEPSGRPTGHRTRGLARRGPGPLDRVDAALLAGGRRGDRRRAANRPAPRPCL